MTQVATRKASFNYNNLPSEARIVVRQKTQEIHDRITATAQGVRDIGQRLIDVKEQLPHGQFGFWLDSEFAWSERTAQQMMQVAIQFKSANFADLNIGPSALYLMASPSTPEKVREKIIDKAEAGEPITHGAVKEAVETHKEKQAERAKKKAEAKKAEKSDHTAPPSPPANRKPAAPPEKPADAVAALPPRIRAAFIDDNETVMPALELHRQMTALVNRLVGDGDTVEPSPAGQGILTYNCRQELLAKLKDVRRIISGHRPHALCPYCKGTKQKCEGCKGLGWVAKDTFDAAPSEMKTGVRGAAA